MTKGSVHQEDGTLINMYVPHNRASKYMKQKLTQMKGEIDTSTIMVGNFHTLLLIMDKSS